MKYYAVVEVGIPDPGWVPGMRRMSRGSWSSVAAAVQPARRGREDRGSTEGAAVGGDRFISLQTPCALYRQNGAPSQ